MRCSGEAVTFERTKEETRTGGRQRWRSSRHGGRRETYRSAGGGQTPLFHDVKEKRQMASAPNTVHPANDGMKVVEAVGIENIRFRADSRNYG